jgi:hypothetical protein
MLNDRVRITISYDLRIRELSETVRHNNSRKIGSNLYEAPPALPMKVIHITRTCPDVQVVYVHRVRGQTIYLIAVKVIYSMFINIQTEYSTAYILRRDLRDPCMPFMDACRADKPSGDKRGQHDNVLTTIPWHRTPMEF